MSSRMDIAKVLLGLAEYYDKQLTKLQIEAYIEDLCDIPLEELIKAVQLYRRDPKNEKFPLPAKLRGVLQPPDDQRARDAVGRILGAIGRIGNYEWEKAKEYIGELGWAVVKNQGGWEQVCSTMTYENMGILQAQWRDLAISLITKHRIGIPENEGPALEFKPRKTPGLESFVVGMIQIPKKDD